MKSELMHHNSTLMPIRSDEQIQDWVKEVDHTKAEKLLLAHIQTLTITVLAVSPNITE